MEYLRRTYALPFLALLLAAFLAGCKCEPIQTDYFLTTEERVKLHYANGEEFVMENGAGDQMRIKAIGPQRSIVKTNSIKDCVNCCSQEFNSETYRVGLLEVDGAFEAAFQVQATAIFDQETFQDVALTTMHCRLQDVEFYWSQVADSAGMDRYYPNSSLHDSLVVRGHTYRRVWEVLGNWADYGGVYGNRIWFAEDGGLVRLGYTDGVVWERLP